MQTSCTLVFAPSRATCGVDKRCVSTTDGRWPDECVSPPSVGRMGKNNRARRAAKAKQRARQRTQQGAGSPRRGPDSWRDADRPGTHDPILTDAERAELAWCHAAEIGIGARSGDPAAGRRTLEALPWRVALTVAERLIHDHVALLWEHGWQPSELHRQGRVAARGPAAGLVEWAVACDLHRQLAAATVLSPRWREQAEVIVDRDAAATTGWLGRWELAARSSATQPSYHVIIEAMQVLFKLPPLDVLVPPPGHQRVAEAPGRAVSDPMLDRVRALLAKAESTDYEAEATALTAKAQELITRHAIDAAVVAGESSTGTDRPSMIRVPIDAPYADAKSLLLQTVATATRCRTAFSQRVAMSTVVGFPDDLAAVEMLFTSLLVQAQHAMTQAGRVVPPGSRSRSQGFRSTFLLAYSQRIGERLDEINAHVFSAAEDSSGSFLPVLRSQECAIDDFMSERFGALTSSVVRGGYSASGWASGRLAADQAQLTSGRIDEGSAEATTGIEDEHLF
ncbi:DUF2786 domain-containing protein [Nocardioides sp. BGMRC 2183]|nr:DUF2786 domain-containing protein [Nocardioides sp. BGMRC 2183]